MARSFYLALVASTLVVSSYAQDACCSQPTVIQVNADGTHSVLINLPNTTTYVNTQTGGFSNLPCNTLITHDPSPRPLAQPFFTTMETNLNLPDTPNRLSSRGKVYGRKPESHLKGISRINTESNPYRAKQTAKEEWDKRDVD